MNRLKSSGECRICRTWLEGLWARATSDAERASVARQMDNGMCDACQCLRLAAAIEYERASYEIRLLHALGARFIRHRSIGSEAIRQAQSRIERANDQCVALKMWPSDRAARPNYREES